MCLSYQFRFYYCKDSLITTVLYPHNLLHLELSLFIWSFIKLLSHILRKYCELIENKSMAYQNL